jgi:hypothetical protein
VLVVLTWLAVVVAATMPWGAHAAKPTEEELKAAYLYNLAKFAQAPAWETMAPGAPVRFCILGQHPFGDALEGLTGKKVRNRPVALDFMRTAGPASDCHVLFIGGSEAERARRLLQSLRDMPVLTVSDIRGFADEGGMIGLVVKDRRLRFEINLGAARAAGLTLSAQLLKLAIRVVGGDEGR